MSAPVIAWRNLLAEGQASLTAGTLDGGSRLDDLFSADLLRPCRIAADASGTITVQVDISAIRHIGYGTLGYGIGPYGRWTIQAVILGAARHDPAGLRPARADLTINGTPIPDYGYPNASWIVLLDPPLDADILTITISGRQAGEVLSIPHIYAGPMLRMPPLDLGYDPYMEESVASSFRAESGRVYQALRYRRIRARPSWSVIPADLWSWLDIVREEALELRRAIWWAWDAEAAPHEVYLVRHDKSTAEAPITRPQMRRFSLDLAEVL